jgi:hypothetical protein
MGFNLKKGLGVLAAALGLMSVPVGAVESAAPKPVEATQAPSPVAKTDGRHTRYYVPKGVRQRERSRLSILCERFGTGPMSKNRFARRSVIKAAVRGLGRLVEGFDSREQRRYLTAERGGKPAPLRDTTARAVERARRARSMGFKS